MGQKLSRWWKRRSTGEKDSPSSDSDPSQLPPGFKWIEGRKFKSTGNPAYPSVSPVHRFIISVSHDRGVSHVCFIAFIQIACPTMKLRHIVSICSTTRSVSYSRDTISRPFRSSSNVEFAYSTPDAELGCGRWRWPKCIHKVISPPPTLLTYIAPLSRRLQRTCIFRQPILLRFRLRTQHSTSYTKDFKAQRFGNLSGPLPFQNCPEY